MPELAPISPVSLNGPPACVERSRLRLEELPPRPKLLLLGEPGALSAGLGFAFSVKPNDSTRVPGVGLCLWLSPRQHLLLFDRDCAAPRRAALGAAAPPGRALDAGARYCELAITGDAAADLLNVGCSLDLSEAALPPGSCAQTRIERVPAIILRSSACRFELFAERPLFPYLWAWLLRASEEFQPA